MELNNFLTERAAFGELLIIPIKDEPTRREFCIQGDTLIRPQFKKVEVQMLQWNFNLVNGVFLHENTGLVKKITPNVIPLLVTDKMQVPVFIKGATPAEDIPIMTTRKEAVITYNSSGGQETHLIDVPAQKTISEWDVWRISVYENLTVPLKMVFYAGTMRKIYPDQVPELRWYEEATT